VRNGDERRLRGKKEIKRKEKKRGKERNEK
jgi:hypothetical protein